MARMVIITNTESNSGSSTLAAVTELADALRAQGHEVDRAESVSQASGDVIFAEPAMFSSSSAPTDTPVVVWTTAQSTGDAVNAIDAVKSGAYDLLQLPASASQIELTAWRALRCGKLMRENEALRGGFAPSASDNITDLNSAAKNLAGKPLADIEKQVILSTLEQFKGHRLRTAAALGIGVRTLGMKIKRWREEGEPIAGRQPRPPVHVDVS